MSANWQSPKTGDRKALARPGEAYSNPAQDCFRIGFAGGSITPGSGVLFPVKLSHSDSTLFILVLINPQESRKELQ